MPLPWKKVKSTRISQLVNDHIHKSQKRRDGSSLVVETGFPTSLIDLFIKNREKLKKSSKKKREISSPVPSQNGVNDPINLESPVSSPPPQSPSSMSSQVNSRLPPAPTPLPFNTSCPLQSASPFHLPLVASTGVNEIDVRDREGGGAESKCGSKNGVDEIGIALAALKIILVAVLALGTKRLTVGITLSAFLLFFLEYAGNRLRGLVKPCSKAKGWLISMLLKVPKLRYKDDIVDKKRGDALLLKVQQGGFLQSKPSSKCRESIHHIQEIEIEEPNQCLTTIIDEIQPEKEIVEDSCFKGKSRIQENESKGVLIGKEGSALEVAKLRRKARKDKVKSKMKMFVPKKFRSLRKEHNFKRLEAVEEDNTVVLEEQGRDEFEDEGESETASRLSSISSGRFKEDGMNTIYEVGGLLEIDEEVTTNKRGGGGCEETESPMNWCYIVMCLTVLVGLIGGRASALVLTLSWFLVLKLGKTLTRYREVLVIESFDDKSD